MNTFDEREKVFEAKFKQDEFLKFKFTAKRNKLLGEFAIKVLHNENPQEYFKEVRESNLEKPGDEDIIDKLTSDFESKTINVSKEDIIKKIEECGRLAIDKFNQKK